VFALDKDGDQSIDINEFVDALKQHL